ncbi:hypothetical protein [Flavobacterium sp.]
METATKSCHAALLSRIEELRAMKAEQEIRINQQYKDLKGSFSVGNILKESIDHIANDKDSQKNIVKMAANTGVNFLIEKVLGRNNSIKGYIGSLVAEKISSSFIGKMIAKL